MKNKVILFILILFIIIGLNNCCSAFETDTEYVVDFSSIGGDLKVSFSSDNFPTSQELGGLTITDFDGVLIGYYNNYYVLYLIRTGSNVYLDSSDSSTLYISQNLNGSYIYSNERFSFSTSRTTAELTSADAVGTYGSMWVNPNRSFNCTQTIYSNNTFTTIYDNNNYINDSSNIIQSAGNGLERFLFSLISYINVDSMFTIFGYSVSLIVVAVLFVLGFYLLRKLLFRLK